MNDVMPTIGRCAECDTPNGPLQEWHGQVLCVPCIRSLAEEEWSEGDDD